MKNRNGFGLGLRNIHVYLAMLLMADGVAENDGCHDGQKKIYIYINSLKLKKTMDYIQIN